MSSAPHVIPLLTLDPSLRREDLASSQPYSGSSFCMPNSLAWVPRTRQELPHGIGCPRSAANSIWKNVLLNDADLH